MKKISSKNQKGKMNKWVFRFMLMLIALVLLSSCRSEPKAPMRIGTNIWIGYEPVWLAQDLKYFDTDSVKPVQFPSATTEMAAFRSKTIDAAALTLDEALTLAQFEPDFSIVLIVDISNGGDVILGRPEIKSMKDLRGKRIGAESTAVGAYTLARGLKKAGLKYEEVKVINLNENEHEAAFRGGTIDALVTFEPVRTKLLKSGARLLFDSSQIPNEIIDVIIVRKEYLKKNMDIVEQFINGWFRALTYMKEQPSDAAEKIKGRLKLNADEVSESYKGLRLPDRNEVLGMLSGANPPLLNAAKNIQTLMLEQHLLIKKNDVSILLDKDLLKKLYRQ